MYLLTASEMRECDSRTIQSHVPGPVLMERAAHGIFREIRHRFDRLNRRRIWIVCGRGNNGGDGLVLARLLWDHGLNPRVFLADPAAVISGDAGLQVAPLRARGVPLEETHPDSLPPFDRLEAEDLLIDALLGTGFKGTLAGLKADLVRAMNRSCATLVAVDIPSGLSADSGLVGGDAIRADLTVTMGSPKRCFLFWPARDHVGEWVVADIGIPEAVYAAVDPPVRLLQEEDLAGKIPAFPRDAHKGARGKVLVIGGSPGLTGAPCLSAIAAARSGAGLVRVAVPRSLNAIFEAKLTEPMTFPVEETDLGTISPRSFDFLLGLSGQWDALVLGPGLGLCPETDRLVRDLYREWSGPLIVDADGLVALSAGGLPPRPAASPCPVLTPHPGEMSRLVGRPSGEILADPIAAAREFAMEHRVVLVLKSAPAVISGPDGSVLVNTTGNPGLSTGGSGDVLSGIIGTFLAQRLEPVWAAGCAVFLHGRSADLLAGHRTERSFSPSDVADALALAWAGLLPDTG